ncbi:MAG: phosphatase PAP2 family protein [Nitrospiraceae bacterium]|nr:phosphatase PAP2 family protein [Nitrospiraceae bacterium]
MAFVYLVLFSSVIAFTFVVLAYTEQMTALKKFTLVFILDYLIAFPFYLLFPVSVTGYTLPDVQPLLYKLNPVIYAGITTVDPLDNCFPSLHTALVFSALLIICTTNLRRYKIFLTFVVPAVIYATLYLGIHWITDIIAGVILSLFTLHIANRYCERIMNYANAAAVRIEAMIGVGDMIVCTECAYEIVIVPHIRSVNCPRCGAHIEHRVP